MAQFGPPGPRDWGWHNPWQAPTRKWYQQGWFKIGVPIAIVGALMLCAIGNTTTYEAPDMPSQVTTATFNASWLENQLLDSQNMFGGPGNVAEAHCASVDVDTDGVGTYTCQVRAFNETIESTYNAEITTNGTWAAQPEG